MCGLAGLSSRIPLGMAARRQGEHLSEHLSHRGPDGHGAFISAHVALYHRRLAIIDQRGGAQPFASNRGNVLVLNGMIYNDRALRAQLPDAQFKTDCDSETPLYLYEKYGESFTEHLRAMYALALYDKEQDLLILARDAYGIKPLYYAQKDGVFSFASEPQALLKAGVVKPKLHHSKAVELLQLKFTTGRQTAFAGIKRVLPGEMIFVRGGEIVRRMRSDPFASSSITTLDEKTALEKLDTELRGSVRLYTRSDVGFGVFLSGGVDSCSIMAALRTEDISDFPCYTASFPGGGLHDEAHTAQQVCNAVGARHIPVEITAEDFWDVLPSVVTHVDDPSTDPAMAANYLLARRAHEDVKVILGGDGGDEIFAGYRRYERALLPKFIPAKPLRGRGQFDCAPLARFLGEDWRVEFAATVADAAGKTRTQLQALQATDGADFLPHFHLMKLDRCLMAYGIEGRVPLLDQRLASFGFNLPDKLKLRGRKGKWLLRRWLHNTLPEAGAFSRKRGFSTPVNKWIADKAPDLRSFVCDQLGVRDMFEIDKISGLFSAKTHKYEKLRWPILFYALWHTNHILQERPVLF